MEHHLNKYRFLIISTLILLVAGCANMVTKLPAITDSPTNIRLTGKVVWHDLLTDTPEASMHFYSELFGWEFEKLGVNPGFFHTVNYTLIRHNDKLIGGMVDQNRLNTEVDVSQWVVLLSVNDVDKATDILKNAGGTVFSPPGDLADRGRIAIVADPQGAHLALLETKMGDPLDVDEPSVGDFLWHELWTSDITKATEFYQSIAPYRVEEREVKLEQTSANFRLLSTNDQLRIGIFPNPVEDLAPVWVSYVRVEDEAALDAIVERVEDLGGSLLLAPQDRAIGGRVAFIADPSGAGIAIQTWP